MKIVNSIFIIFFLSVFLVACSSTTDPAEAYKGETAEQIFQNGEQALRKDDFSEASKRFEALDAQYPFSTHATIGQLHIIYAYYMNEDYASASAAADRFIHAHPTYANVDYAYFMRGLADYKQNIGIFERVFGADFSKRDLSMIRKSFNDFSNLVTRYPDSYYAPMAQQYMIYLRNFLAKHQLEVAQYYMSRKAYIAAANRASELVQHYQGSPYVPQALLIMVQAYQQLHLTELSNQSLKLLEYNYPSMIQRLPKPFKK